MTDASIVTFNYVGLELDQADALRSAAKRIRDRMRNSIVETGRDLLRVKDMLEHGAFTSWLKAEFGMTDRMARNYMAAAELADTKSEIVSVLPATALYRLSAPSTPEATRADIVKRLEKGETMSAKDIAGLVADAREAEAKARRLAKVPPAKLKRMRLSKEQRERKWEAAQLSFNFGAELEKEMHGENGSIFVDDLFGSDEAVRLEEADDEDAPVDRSAQP
jgi:hypothetical protein